MGASISHADQSQQQHPAHLHNTGPSASFRAFKDTYETLGAVQSDLRRAGLESSNLIVGIDFTKSNEWTGRMSFGGKCLHHVGNPGELNPYEQAVSIVGQTLSAFDGEQRRLGRGGERDEGTEGPARAL
jgi:E3 ubiquitin-protein ligase RGLG